MRVQIVKVMLFYSVNGCIFFTIEIVISIMRVSKKIIMI